MFHFEYYHTCLLDGMKLISILDYFFVRQKYCTFVQSTVVYSCTCIIDYRLTQSPSITEVLSGLYGRTNEYLLSKLIMLYFFR